MVGRLACFDVVFPCQVGMFGGMECMRQVFVVCGRCERSVCAVSGRNVLEAAGLCLLWCEVSWYTSWLVDWRVLMLFSRVKWGCLVARSACARCSLFVAGARGAFVQFQVACVRGSGSVAVV